MGLLTVEQINELRRYLEDHGLSYASLQTEMLDHICCDMEMYMEQGLGFEEALDKVKSEIPKTQLKKIQAETMEAINKKIKPTSILMYASFALLVLATLFKLLHLQGAGWVLIFSFGSLALTFITGLLSNPLIREKERGRGALFALAVMILMFLASLCFQLLHLPGTAFLRQVAVLASIILLSSYAIYCYIRPQKVSHHLIMQYIKKEGFGIEKSLIILLVLGTAVKFFWQDDFLFVIFFMLLFSFASVFYFVSSWQYYVNEQAHPIWKWVLLVVSIMAYVLFMLPTIRLIGEPLRIAMVWGTITFVPSVMAIYYFVRSNDTQRVLLGSLSFVISVLGGVNWMAKLNFLSVPESQYLLSFAYNPVVFVGLFIAFIVFFKRPMFRGLLLMTLGMFIFSYQMQGI